MFRFLPSVLRRRLPQPSPRTYISFGLASIVGSIVLMLSLTGAIPDGQSTRLEGRERLTESIAIAVNTVLQVETQGDARRPRRRRPIKVKQPVEQPVETIGAMLAAVTDRNPELLSAALRTGGGDLLTQAGDHSLWSPASETASDTAHVRVPILRNDADGESSVWSTLELRFVPVSRPGIVAGILDAPLTKLMVPLGLCCFIAFYMFLGRVLKQLDPAKAVPSRVRSALDTLAEGLLVLDRDGRIVLANSAFAGILQQKPERLVGQTADELDWRTIVDGETTPLPRGNVYPWARSIAEDRAQSNVMLRLQTPGGIRTFVVNCSPVGGDGETQGVLASFEDITILEQKKVELEASMLAAEEANEAKSSFLANMSHEIRTPMNAILGFADVLRRGLVQNDHEKQKHLDTIHSSGRHLLDLINDILDLSKVEAGRLEVERTDCDVHAIISEVVAVLGVKAEEKAIGLTYVSDSPIPATMPCDPTRLRQIVTNIVGNALKFTSDGGVTIATRMDAATRSTPAMLHIDVTDTGIGMKPEVCERIFEAFVQADSSTTRQFGGTGLGLAISRRFAEALGGGIYATSQPGVGSVFHISIAVEEVPAGVPLLTVEEFAAAAAAPTPKSDTNRWRLPSRRVLVVDDGVENRKLIQLVLGKAGLDVQEAGDGRQACDTVAATRPGSEFDLVLMDMQMPVMDGYAATRELRAGGCTLPIIALTGNAMKGDEQKCLDAGCSGFLSKPVDLDELIRTVAAALEVERIDEPQIEAATVATSCIIKVEPEPVAADSGEPEPAESDVADEDATEIETPTAIDAVEEAVRLIPDEFVAVTSDVIEASDSTDGVIDEANEFEANGFDTDEATEFDTAASTAEPVAEPTPVPTPGPTAEPVADPIAELPESLANLLAELSGPETAAPAPLTVSDAPPASIAADDGPVRTSFPLDDADFVEIIAGFVGTLRTRAVDMQAAFDAGDLAALAGHAHWLKGGGGTMGFDAFTDPAGKLEAAAGAGDATACGPLLATICSLIERIEEPQVELV